MSESPAEHLADLEVAAARYRRLEAWDALEETQAMIAAYRAMLG